MHYALLLQIMRYNGIGDLLDRQHSGVRVRKLLCATVLATDMGVHFDFMKKFASLATGTHHSLIERKTLMCQALIKCADISNTVNISYHFFNNYMFIQSKIFRVDRLGYHSIGLVRCRMSGHPKYTWRSILIFPPPSHPQLTLWAKPNPRSSSSPLSRNLSST